jgi:hypothetical protein
MINLKKVLKFLPTIGILVFIGIYIYASKLYPGGSQIDLKSESFDWLNNHWCNLMRETGMNGVINHARPIAILGITILCISMIVFFFQFADHFEKHRIWNISIKISGALGMVSAVFIFTTYHDLMTTILSICGSVVIIGMIRALHKKRLTLFKIIGLFCILVVGLNNFFYYNENLIKYSPVVQKIAFILILSWTIGLNYLIHKQNTLQQRG